MERVWKIVLSDDERPSRIVVLAGAGVEKADAAGDLVVFAERYEIPAATTLRAKGCFLKTTTFFGRLRIRRPPPRHRDHPF
jgi:acetolactate synthase-1/2/3 large subunit